jgi:hypothetical protein
MWALHFNDFGGPAVLRVEDVTRRRRLEMMGPYFASGRFRPLPIAATYSLDDARQAYKTWRPQSRPRRDQPLTRREASTCRAI